MEEAEEVVRAEAEGGRRQGRVEKEFIASSTIFLLSLSLVAGSLS